MLGLFHADSIHSLISPPLSTLIFLVFAFLFETLFAVSEVTLSKIMSWYSKDFGNSKLDVLRWLHSFVAEDQQVKLKVIIESGHVSLKYRPYDWASNSK